MFGRVRMAWLASIAIHGVLVAVFVWWLWDDLDRGESPPEPVTLNLAMFQAPVPAEPTPQPAPVEPAVEPAPEPVPVEPASEPMPEPEPTLSPDPELAPVEPPPLSPTPVLKPAPKPAPKPKPKPVPPKPTPPKPAKAETRPEESVPTAPVESPPALAPSPTPATPPMPRPVAASLDPALEDAYKASIRQAIEQKKRYPRLARRMGDEGRVVLAFTLKTDGSLAQVRVVESSGSELLDEAAMQAVRDAAPFPPFPAGVERSRWTFTLPIAFVLDR